MSISSRPFGGFESAPEPTPVQQEQGLAPELKLPPGTLKVGDSYLIPTGSTSLPPQQPAQGPSFPTASNWPATSERSSPQQPNPIRPRMPVALPKPVRSQREPKSWSLSQIVKSETIRRHKGKIALAGLLALTSASYNSSLFGPDTATEAGIIGVGNHGLPPVRGDSISENAAVGRLIINSKADVSVPINLIGGGSGEVGLPSGHMPSVDIDADVTMYLSGATDARGGIKVFAKQKGGHYVVDRHQVNLTSSFALLPCPTVGQAAKKACVTGFTGATHLSPKAGVSAAEATRINDLLRVDGKQSAVYQTAVVRKLEMADLTAAEDKCSKPIQQLGDNALRTLLVGQSKRYGVTVNPKSITFMNAYNPMSAMFAATNKAELNNKAMTLKNTVNSCDAATPSLKGAI